MGVAMYRRLLGTLLLVAAAHGIAAECPVVPEKEASVEAFFWFIVENRGGSEPSWIICFCRFERSGYAGPEGLGGGGWLEELSR